MSLITEKLQIKHRNSFIEIVFAYIKEFSIPAIYLTVLVGLIIFIVSKYYPKVGHDYGFFIPRMLDTHLHHKVNGVSIQWYTANFGAGTPAYPNPQYIQYSLPQFLMFVVNPWTALMLSLVTYATIGFTCFYFFLRNEMGWINNAAALGASFILANGFFVDHAIVGHVGFQTFPLLGMILLLAFNKRLNTFLAGILIGFVVAMIVNQAGFIILIIFALSLLILLPLIYLMRPELVQLKLFVTFFVAGFSAIVLCISKVSAVMAFMRFFPRFIADSYGKTYVQGIIGMTKQLTGFDFIVPYYWVTGRKLADISLFFQKGTGTSFGIWETNLVISPALVFLLILGIGCGLVLLKKAAPYISKGKVVAILCLCLAVWLTIDMSLAQGWLFKIVKPLPVIRSLHANIRYTAAFIFPLSLLGAYVFDEVFKTRPTGSWIAFGIGSMFTIAMLCLYFVIPQDVYVRSFRINSSLATYAKLDKGWNPALQTISDITDIETFELQSSNLASQDPIFGYHGEYFKPHVVPGPIMEIHNGHYNMTNPAGYVFPKENDLQPFEPFRVDEKTDLELFINHKQPNLKISNWQKFADGINLVALLIALLFLIFETAKVSLRIWQTMFQRNRVLEKRVI